jgi:ribonuclease HII
MFRPSSKPATGGPERVRWRHSGHTPRRNAGLAAYENVLARAGLSPVAGIDEAGRGACAGPLVVAAVVLDSAAIRRLPGLADSKALTPDEREAVYAHVMRVALDWHVLAVPALEVDALGLHVCNVEGMRRALAGLSRRPAFVLTDGFPVRGLGTPTLAVWKGDQVTASVAAASIVAKITRDRMMVALDEHYPAYGFARHKGYSTPEHMTALREYGPCPEHRYSYTNVIQANRRWATGWQPDASVDEGTVTGEGTLIEDGTGIDEDAVIEGDASIDEGGDLEVGGFDDDAAADGGAGFGAGVALGDGAADGDGAGGDAVAAGQGGTSGARLPGGGSEDFRLSPADGTEPTGPWADVVAREIAAAEVSQTGSAWADTSQAETRLGDAARAEERRMDPWLRSGYGAPPVARGPRDGEAGSASGRRASSTADRRGEHERGRSREVRSRDGAAALSRVPRRRWPV